MFRSPYIERISIFILIAVVFLSVHQCRSNKQEKDMLSNDLKINKDSIHFYRLKNGSLVAEKQSYQLTIDDYKNEILTDQNQQKELKKRIGKLNRLTNQLKIQLTAKGDIQMPVTDTLVIIKHDTIKAGGLHFHDRFLTLNGILLNDSLNLNYQFRTGLDIVSYWKSEGLFKSRSLVVNVKPDNPYVTITGLDNYAIVEKKPFYQTKGFWFGIGFISAYLITRH